MRYHFSVIILGIETSCDETSIAVLEEKRGQISVRSNIISSQIEVHKEFGGVVPNLAAREHAKNLPIVLKQSLKKAKTKIEDIDAIAVTSGPGLIPALLVGVAFSKALSWKYDIPLIGTNHMEGHIYSPWLDSDLKLSDRKIFPALCLIVSGGHTQLILMKDHLKYKLIGQTVDDAAGEAFDKIARILGLPYPGGPAIAACAERRAGPMKVNLPRPMLHTKNYNFSFSGLKTAVLYKVRDLKEKYSIKKLQPIIAREAQNAIVDVLIAKTKRAAKEFKTKSLMLSGGVSANKQLRSELQSLGKELDLPVFIPKPRYTTDNAAMIAMAAIANIKQKGISKKNVKADANWELV